MCVNCAAAPSACARDHGLSSPMNQKTKRWPLGDHWSWHKGDVLQADTPDGVYNFPQKTCSSRFYRSSGDDFVRSTRGRGGPDSLVCRSPDRAGRDNLGMIEAGHARHP